MDNEQRKMVAALGARMASIRHGRGLTQDQLAGLSGVDVQALRRAETGRSALSYDRLRRVADAMGASVSTMFDFEGALPEPTGDPMERQLLAAYRSLPADRRRWAVRVVEALATTDPLPR